MKKHKLKPAKIDGHAARRLRLRELEEEAEREDARELQTAKDSKHEPRPSNQAT